MSDTTPEAATNDTPQDGADFEGDFDADKAQKLIKALRADKRALQAKVTESTPALEELAKIKADQLSETERWQTYAKQFEDRANTAERELMRSKVALEKGLPANLAARLQGDDEAALKADADELLSLVPKDTTPRAPRLDPSQGSSANGGKAGEPRDQFASILHQTLGR